MQEDGRTWWALLITDGTVVEFAPELYSSRNIAVDEARRWAWLLSAEGGVEITEPFDGRIRVGIRDVRIVEIGTPDQKVVEPWVGSFWSTSGYPDPEAVMLSGFAQAREWVTSPIRGLTPVTVGSTPWHIGATFVIRGEEAYAVAQKAKVICNLHSSRH
jgi:hypothetical protein